MVRMKRTIPMHIRLARMKDVKDNACIRKRMGIKYPNCIGTFPECEKLNIGEKIKDCELCLHNAKEEIKTIGEPNMSEEIKEPKIKNRSTPIALEELAKRPYETLTGGQKAYLKRSANKGVIKYTFPEVKKKE